MEQFTITREHENGTPTANLGTCPTYKAAMSTAAMLARCGRDGETYVVTDTATRNEWAFPVKPRPVPAVPATVRIEEKATRR